MSLPNYNKRNVKFIEFFKYKKYSLIAELVVLNKSCKLLTVSDSKLHTQIKNNQANLNPLLFWTMCEGRKIVSLSIPIQTYST